MKNIPSDVKDLKLAPEGKLKIEWSLEQMPVLSKIRERFRKQKIFDGLTIATCLHITSETANLLITLKAGGARVVANASNPLSTQDSVAASLVSDFGIPTFAIKGEDNKVYYSHLNTVLDFHPQITIDDGGDLIHLLHTKRKSQLNEVIGSSEETTTGVIRLRAMEKEGALKIPVIAVNDSDTKHLFDNRYGTGQSTIDGILRATNTLLAGKKFVVGGYGWCGRGVAARARGMGSEVTITEINPIRAIEARMDGYAVMPMSQAAEIGDIFVTATGNRNVIDQRHFGLMKDGAILCNVGHFNVEVDIEALEKNSMKTEQIRPEVTGYMVSKGKTLFVLSQGRLVNLAAAEGHPASIMDLSFAGQAKAVEFIVK